MQRRPEFSFPGSPARGPADGLLPPRPPVPPRPREQEEEEVRWLQASRQASPDYHYHHSSSGTPSPQLWAPHHSQHPNRRQYPASAGSSPSRAQAIAGYRREMLDLVRGLPESAYELSLRDIVEHRHPSTSSPPSSTPHLPPSSSNTEPAKQGRRRRKQRSRSLERSVSLDTGLLVKFFVPLCIRAGKKKVSPKPDAKDAAKKEKNKNQGTKKNKEAARQKQDDECCTKSELSSRASSTGSSNSSGNPRAPVRSRSR
jgi:hypothetical protein